MRSCQPVACRQKLGVEFFLGTAGIRMPVIAPARDRRKRHEDRLGAAVGLKAEQRAAIVDKIKLDVAPAAVCLEIALAIPVGEILAPQHDRIVRDEKMLTDALRQREAM